MNDFLLSFSAEGLLYVSPMSPVQDCTEKSLSAASAAVLCNTRGPGPLFKHLCKKRGTISIWWIAVDRSAASPPGAESRRFPGHATPSRRTKSPTASPAKF